MTLNITLSGRCSANGTYTVKAKDCAAVSLYWAAGGQILPEMTAFAYIPVQPSGTGIFEYSGGRAIPSEATQVLARGISADFMNVRECIVPLPCQDKDNAESCEDTKRFVIINDLHLSSKTGTVLRALRTAEKFRPDAILMPGDLANDGTCEQIGLLHNCFDGLSGIPICVAAGNHDYPRYPIPYIIDGICSYPTLQDWAIQRSTKLGIECISDESGAYSVCFGSYEVIGLNAVSHWRRFVFPNGDQLEWLSNHLESSTAVRHILLCHAPLFRHIPCSDSRRGGPYLSRDKELQDIVDTYGNIIFISGHTHLSPNNISGCVEYDREHKNIYINNGSVRPTELREKESIVPSEWLEGCVTELCVSSNKVTVRSYSLQSMKKFSRSLYEFDV